MKSHKAINLRYFASNILTSMSFLYPSKKREKVKAQATYGKIFWRTSKEFIKKLVPMQELVSIHHHHHQEVDDNDSHHYLTQDQNSSLQLRMERLFPSPTYVALTRSLNLKGVAKLDATISLPINFSALKARSGENLDCLYRARES